MLVLFLESLLISSELKLCLEDGCFRFLRIDGELLKVCAALFNTESGSLQSTEIPFLLGGVHKETELNFSVWM